MSWEASPILFEDEPSEDELLARFVKYSALYPKVDPQQIGDFVFQGLRDPFLRSSQAVALWLSRLDVRERIRVAKLNGGENVKALPTKEERMRQLYEIMQDDTVKPSDRINAHRLYSEIEKEIGAAGGKAALPEGFIPAQVVIAQYAD